jgi:hypothetical protein
VFDFESYQDAYDAWQERLEAGYLKLGECIIAYRRCVAKGSGRVVRRLVTTGRAARSPR